MIVLAPAAFVAVSETVKVPAVVYVLEGFSAVLVFPSPKSHNHEVGKLVEVSVNWTVRGAEPDVGVPVKLETGYTGTVVVAVMGAVVVTGVVVVVEEELVPVVTGDMVVVVVTSTVVVVVVTEELSAATGMTIHARKKNPTKIIKKGWSLKNPSDPVNTSFLLSLGLGCIVTTDSTGDTDRNSQCVADLLFSDSQIVCCIG